ncbi:MAG: hypothetical protein Q8P45_03310 [Candidatus Harrisonbacteria bacterium]|nr:hypothetical protein [Candidatus Harrisonbacteria bacterium]
MVMKPKYRLALVASGLAGSCIGFLTVSEVSGTWISVAWVLGMIVSAAAMGIGLGAVSRPLVRATKPSNKR